MKLQAGIALLGCFYGTASAACTDNTKKSDCKGDSEGFYDCVWLWKSKTCKSDGNLECSDFNGAKKQCLENGTWDCFFNKDTKECTEDPVDCGNWLKKKKCEKNAECSWTNNRCMNTDDLSSCGTFDNWRWGCLTKSSPASGKCVYTKSDKCISGSSAVASDFDGMKAQCRKLGYEIVNKLCVPKAVTDICSANTEDLDCFYSTDNCTWVANKGCVSKPPTKKCSDHTKEDDCYNGDTCMWIGYLSVCTHDGRK